MSRRRKGRDIHGIVLLDKPSGMSSNRALQKVRALFQARKAGHTGNLDPFATGMLPICLGEASKTAGFMLDAAKTYVAKALLGRATTTGDPEGEVVRELRVPELGADEISTALRVFTGAIEQVPPMYSALKHEGQPLYKLARQGREVERKPRSVTIHSLELLHWESPSLEFRVRCSKGTYVRTLAEDIAEHLGSCAHLVALRRLQVDPFREQDMIGLDALAALADRDRAAECLLPPDAGLDHLPVVELPAAEAERFRHGNPVACGAGPAVTVRVRSAAGALLGLGEITADGLLKPRRVMNLEP